MAPYKYQCIGISRNDWFPPFSATYWYGIATKQFNDWFAFHYFYEINKTFNRTPDLTIYPFFIGIKILLRKRSIQIFLFSLLSPCFVIPSINSSVHHFSAILERRKDEIFIFLSIFFCPKKTINFVLFIFEPRLSENKIGEWKCFTIFFGRPTPPPLPLRMGPFK